MDIENFFKAIDWVKLTQLNLGTEGEVREIIREIDKDIAAGLTKIRMIIERLVDYIYEKQWGKDQTPLWEKIKSLDKINIFPPKIFNNINYLRAMGNLGPHPQPPSIYDVQGQDVRDLLPAFFAVIEWFVREELPLIRSSNALFNKSTPDLLLYCETPVTLEERRVLEELEHLCHFPIPPLPSADLIEGQIGFVANGGNITSLSLYNQHFKEIPVCIRYLKNLKYLNLQGNQLQALPVWITSFSQLETLNLSHNPLPVIPEVITNLQKIKGLCLDRSLVKTLEGKRLKQKGVILKSSFLERRVFHLRRLLGLDTIFLILFLLLSEIRTVPSYFMNLIVAGVIIYGMYAILTTVLLYLTIYIIVSRLREQKSPPLHYANVKDRNFAGILVTERDSISRLETRLGSPVGVLNAPRDAGLSDPNCGYFAISVHITHITLKGRNLTEIPPELKEFTYLQSLDLQGNRIRSLPDWFQTFQLLEDLNLSQNRGIKLPESLLSFPHLHNLTLSNPFGNHNIINRLRQSGTTVTAGKWWNILPPIILLAFYLSFYFVNYVEILFPSTLEQDFTMFLLLGVPIYLILVSGVWNILVYAGKKMIHYLR